MDCRFAGHPLRPRLVAPSEVTPRKMNTVEGYAAMLHAIAHIEFNAINLALDAAYRFRNMPFQFVRDWVRVAKEEVFHFGLMRGRLNSLGYDYGDFEAHGHLWDMAYKNGLRSLVAHGFGARVIGSASVWMLRRVFVQKWHSVAIWKPAMCWMLFYRDEVGHVAIGNHWYQHLCRERGLEPVALFRSLIARYDMFIFRGYVNIEARERAGFSRFELDMLEDFEKSLKQDKKAV